MVKLAALRLASAKKRLKIAQRDSALALTQAISLAMLRVCPTLAPARPRWTLNSAYDIL